MNEYIFHVVIYIYFFCSNSKAIWIQRLNYENELLTLNVKQKKKSRQERKGKEMATIWNREQITIYTHGAHDGPGPDPDQPRQLYQNKPHINSAIH